MKSMINLQNVSFRYDASEEIILKQINLQIQEGEFLCVIGHSGCGKSTLIRLLAGLEHPIEGSIEIGGEPMQGPDTDRAIVFQQYSLFPWMTVYKNVLYAVMKTGRFSKETAKQRTEWFLDKAGMLEHMQKYPYQLSGGMRQRTSIARALAMDVKILLLDEPFGALDVQNRSILQELLHTLWLEEKKTVVFVTHDLDEALHLATRIVFLKNGEVARELSDRISLRTSLEDWYYEK